MLRLLVASTPIPSDIFHFTITAFDYGLIQAHGLSIRWKGFFGWPMKAQARRPLARWYGRVDPWAGVDIGGSGGERCTPAMCVSPAVFESCRLNDLCHHSRNFRGNLGSTGQMIYVSFVTVISFFAKLKARSHSQDVVGQDSVSNAHW